MPDMYRPQSKSNRIASTRLTRRYVILVLSSSALQEIQVLDLALASDTGTCLVGYSRSPLIAGSRGHACGFGPLP